MEFRLTSESMELLIESIVDAVESTDDRDIQFELVKTTTARKVKDTRHSPTLTILPSDFDSDGFFISSLKKGI